MLYNEQTKAAKELQRRIDKLRSEGKDPALSVKPSPSSGPSPGRTGNNAASASAAQDSSNDAGQATNYTQPMSDSHIPVDESFMLLAGQRSDPGDAFNQFWSIMQGMLDNLSQPVAFATVPLNNEENLYPPRASPSRSMVRDGGLSSDTEPEEPLVSRMSRKLGFGLGMKSSSSRRTSMGATHSLPEEEFDEFSIDDLSESFCVVPSDSSVNVLKAENASLKAKIEALKSQLAATERVLKVRKEQDQQLRDSIVMARREAQRAMATSTIGVAGAGAMPMPMPPLQRNPTGDFMKLPGSPVLSPVVGITSGREAQYTKRIRELEDEVKALTGDLKTTRAENEKHKAVIAKFRERWDKLKESAKKKKEARARLDTPTSLPDQIPEESIGEGEED
jgi:cell division protein FtsB